MIAMLIGHSDSEGTGVINVRVKGEVSLIITQGKLGFSSQEIYM